MKKVALLFLACSLVVGLIYGVIWIGDSPVSAEISQEAKGQFVRMEDGGKKLVAAYDGTEKTYPVADNVWVYRNSQKSGIADLQQGDTLEIILNNKSQAAYIKAASSTPAAPAAEPAPHAAPQAPAAAPSTTSPSDAAPPSTPQAGLTPPPSSPAPAAKASPAPQPQSAAAVKASAVAEWPWERLSLELKSRELMLKVKQEQTDNGSVADIYMQTKDRAVIHLNGAEAEKMLRLMLQGLPQERGTWEKALKQRLGAEFKLKDTSPDWKLDIRWKDDMKPVSVPAAVEKPQPEPKVKGYEKEKEHGNEKEKEQGKEKDKDKEKGKG